MASIKKRDFVSSLNRKGFREDVSKRKRRPHDFFYLYYNGKKTSIRTHVSRGNDEINDPLINRIQKQMHLTKQQLFAFVECSVSESEYIKILKKNGNLIP